MTDLRARLAEVLADHANDADFIDYGGTIGPLIDFVFAPALDRALEDAERYAWLRQQHWESAEMCVVSKPKASVKLGSDCPSKMRLDTAIDAARAKG